MNTVRESSITQVSDRNLAMETAGQCLKLKVFVEKNKENDFWFMETDENDNDDSDFEPGDTDVDSDFELGDTESFTESRVEMKKQRLVLLVYFIVIYYLFQAQKTKPGDHSGKVDRSKRKSAIHIRF